MICTPIFLIAYYDKDIRNVLYVKERENQNDQKTISFIVRSFSLDDCMSYDDGGKSTGDYSTSRSLYSCRQIR